MDHSYNLYGSCVEVERDESGCEAEAERRQKTRDDTEQRLDDAEQRRKTKSRGAKAQSQDEAQRRRGAEAQRRTD